MDTIPTVRSVFHNQPDHVKIAMIHLTSVMLDKWFSLSSMINTLFQFDDKQPMSMNVKNRINDALKNCVLFELNQTTNYVIELENQIKQNIFQKSELIFSELYRENIGLFEAIIDFTTTIKPVHVLPSAINELLPDIHQKTQFMSFVNMVILHNFIKHQLTQLSTQVCPHFQPEHAFQREFTWKYNSFEQTRHEIDKNRNDTLMVLKKAELKQFHKQTQSLCDRLLEISVQIQHNQHKYLQLQNELQIHNIIQQTDNFIQLDTCLNNYTYTFCDHMFTLQFTEDTYNDIYNAFAELC